MGVTQAGTGRDGGPFEARATPTAATEIDKLVLARLRQVGLEPPDLCSDAVFVRRTYLDVIGTLPTAEEARGFLEDQRPDKRASLIDRLLGRPEFADYWAMKWGDLLRVKAEFPINLWPNAVQAYHQWIRACLRENVPYDRFARELLTASGSNFRVPPVNFYRAAQNREPAGLAQAVALTFLGARADRWPSNELAGLAAFFSQVGRKATGEWKEEIVYFDPGLATNGLWQAARLPDGRSVRLSGDQDPRVVFADWVLAPGNPWFARNLANRVWFWLLGRGLIHEPDDLRPDNPPSNPALLAFLERELVDSHYDLKHLHRLILNSQVYQFSCIPKTRRPEAAANFAAYPVRRLDAEVLIDALNQITGTAEKYTSLIPEPPTVMPEGQRAVALADASVTSPFLEMFGRPPRDTGLEAERQNRCSPEQRLHLLNSSHIQRKLEQSPRLVALVQARTEPGQAVTRLYLTILSRFPTPTEREIVRTYAQTGRVSRREAGLDLAWALINSAEFLYRH
jgi:hypothetical protein